MLMPGVGIVLPDAYTGAGETPLNATSDLTLTASQTGSLVNNNGALGAVVATLPSGANPTTPAVQFGGHVAAAQTLRFLAVGADVIRHGSQESPSGGYIESDDIGALCWLINDLPNIWTVQNWSIPWAVEE